ncbi:MAG: MCE family protein [Phycisphaerae bacterium]|nr:MCE family protein [Phycisphaerae bacterium]
MSEFRRNVMVGLFLVMGLVGLVWLAIMFGEIPMGKTYPIYAYFGNLSNVIEGDEVHMKGVRVGSVKKIGFRDEEHPEQGVQLELAIQNKWRIPRSAYVEVELAAMGFARSFVKIVIPPGPVATSLPTDGSVPLSGETISAFDAMFPPDVVATLQKASSQIGGLAEALTPVADDLHALLKPTDLELLDHPELGAKRVSANLYTAAQRLDSALKHFNEILGDPNTKSNVRVAIQNMREMSEQGKLVMADIKEVARRAKFVAEDTQEVVGKVNKLADKTSTRVEEISRVIIDDAEKLGKFFDHLDAVGRNMAEGKGTAGKFLNDPELYDAMVLTMKRLQLAVEDLNGLVKDWQREGVNVKGMGMFK